MEKKLNLKESKPLFSSICSFAGLFTVSVTMDWKTRSARRTVDQLDGIYYNSYSTVARDLRQRKQPLSLGFDLGLGSVYCHKSLALCYNYNV